MRCSDPRGFSLRPSGTSAVNRDFAALQFPAGWRFDHHFRIHRKQLAIFDKSNTTKVCVFQVRNIS